MPGTLGIAAESRREEEVLHVNDEESCFGGVEGYLICGCGKIEARVDWRGGRGWRVGEVETGGGVVEPEVFGWGADYCWRTGGCGFVGMVVGGGFGCHCWGDSELRVCVGEDGVFG